MLCASSFDHSWFLYWICYWLLWASCFSRVDVSVECRNNGMVLNDDPDLSSNKTPEKEHLTLIATASYEHWCCSEKGVLETTAISLDGFLWTFSMPISYLPISYLNTTSFSFSPGKECTTIQCTKLSPSHLEVPKYPLSSHCDIYWSKRLQRFATQNDIQPSIKQKQRNKT